MSEVDDHIGQGLQCIAEQLEESRKVNDRRKEALVELTATDPEFASYVKFSLESLANAKDALRQINSWVVCSVISTNDEMADSFELIEEISRTKRSVKITEANNKE